MNIATRKLGKNFRHVRMELAREKEHPQGDSAYGYDLLVPLTAEGTLNAKEWAKHQMECRVRRFRPGEADVVGRLRRKRGGQWYFDYGEGEDDDEIGFRLGNERFVPGEYVSIGSDDGMHTYQIKLVESV